MPKIKLYGPEHRLVMDAAFRDQHHDPVWTAIVGDYDAIDVVQCNACGCTAKLSARYGRLEYDDDCKRPCQGAPC